MKPMEHWQGADGQAYVQRQALTIESRRAMFDSVFDAVPTGTVHTIIEFGASTGDNLRAIRQLGGAILTGVEINEAAVAALGKVADSAVLGAIQYFWPERKWDMTFTRGVLIHIPPNELPAAYDTLYRCSRRFILVAEYYSPNPVEVEYRGQMGLLWKRDFAGEMLDRYPDLQLVDYGFVYHRKARMKANDQDDVTWFLMEKQ